LEVAQVVAQLLVRKPQGEEAFHRLDRQTFREPLSTKFLNSLCEVIERCLGRVKSWRSSSRAESFSALAQIVGSDPGNSVKHRTKSFPEDFRKRCRGRPPDDDEVVPQPQ
jgi:hypothetical protein